MSENLTFQEQLDELNAEYKEAIEKVNKEVPSLIKGYEAEVKVLEAAKRLFDSEDFKLVIKKYLIEDTRKEMVEQMITPGGNAAGLDENAAKLRKNFAEEIAAITRFEEKLVTLGERISLKEMPTQIPTERGYTLAQMKRVVDNKEEFLAHQLRDIEQQHGDIMAAMYTSEGIPMEED